MPDLAEATRQYQTTLEALRRTREFIGGSVSFEEELAEASAELVDAEVAMWTAWVNR